MYDDTAISQELFSGKFGAARHALSPSLSTNIVLKTERFFEKTLGSCVTLCLYIERRLRVMELVGIWVIEPMVASTLSIAAEAISKGTVGETVNDAYKALTEKLLQWAPSDVAAFEATPNSIARAMVIMEILRAQSEEDKKLVALLAHELIGKLKERAPAIGLDVERVTGIEANLRKAIRKMRRKSAEKFLKS